MMSILKCGTFSSVGETSSSSSSSSRTLLLLVLCLSLLNVSLAFVPSPVRQRKWSPLQESSSITSSSAQPAPLLKAKDINQRLRTAMEKMKERDRNSRVLQKEDLTIAYQDDHIIVIDKPSGVLSVSSSAPSLCKTVYESFESSFQKNNITMGQMVVHRLGMDTSGLIVFCQTMEAVRGMNTLFRSRQVVKQYEALLCGHIAGAADDESNIIRMPLMRDYERPPYMRISTRDHQEAIASVDDPGSLLLRKKFLEAPKPCITEFKVLARESILQNLPVTRVTLTSISGRTHQLNVHCAAMGHAIVADSVYGWNGEATARGGLPQDDDSSGASLELQQQLCEATTASGETKMRIHATFLSFRHPVTKTMMSIRSPAPF